MNHEERAIRAARVVEEPGRANAELREAIAREIREAVELAHPPRTPPTDDQPLEIGDDFLPVILDLLPLPIYVKDRQGRFTWMNLANAQVMGHTREELLGRTDFDVKTPKARELHDQEQELLRTGRVVEFQHATMQSGPHRGTWSAITKIPLRNEQGEIIGLLGFNQKITLQKEAQSALAEQRRLLNAVLESLPDYVYVKDTQRRFVLCNSQVSEYFGLTPTEIVGLRDEDLMAQKFYGPAVDEEEALLQTGKPTRSREHRFGAGPNRGRWVAINKYPMRDGQGRIVGLVGINRIISDRKRAEAAWSAERNLLRTLIDNLPDFIYVKDRKSRFMLNNRAHLAVLGCESQADAEGKTDLAFFPETLARRYLQDEQELMNEARSMVNHEETVEGGDGKTIWLLTTKVPLLNDEGEVVGLVGISRDISDRKEAEQRLQKQALTDSLTGLANRTLLHDRLGQALRRLERHENAVFALLFLDLDRFKYVNDSYGHMAGDRLLEELATRLRGVVRPTDTVARLGGDEFAVMLEEVNDHALASRMARRVLRRVEEPFEIMGQQLFISCSIGIVLVDRTYADPEEVLRDADIAMYSAKHAGRARFQAFRTKMRTKVVRTLQLETQLRQALEREQFRVYFQPIVWVPKGRIAGFEALIRWQHPTRGLLTPLHFLDLAEEAELMPMIGQWVLREACRGTRQMQEESGRDDLMVCVNLSAREFEQEDLVDRVKNALTQECLQPEALRLEITEGVIMERLRNPGQLLRKLRELKIQLYIDDFGRGFSSLSYLHRYPIDKLKVDRSFVSTIGTSDGDGRVVRAIVALAEALDLEVTAEGVETLEQYRFLKDLNCGFAQGNYFAPPLKLTEATKLLLKPRKW